MFGLVGVGYTNSLLTFPGVVVIATIGGGTTTDWDLTSRQ